VKIPAWHGLKIPGFLAAAALFAMTMQSGIALAESASGTIVLTLPGCEWALEIDVPGYVLEYQQVALDGEAARFHAENERAGTILSGVLEKAPEEGGAERCREYYWSRARSSAFAKNDISMSRRGEWALVEYVVSVFRGERIDQKHLNAYRSHGGYWIDVHLTKMNFKPDDRKYFDAVLDSIRIDREFEPDSLKLFHFGNHFFWQGRYADAVPYYERALEKEKSNRRLSRDTRLVLVDQLGMAHGLSGNPEKAREVYRNAVEKEPRYPMFYYNFACALAESGELEQALENLTLAMRCRKRTEAGRDIPDPRKDPSFMPWLRDARFQAWVKEHLS
jgi:tetratricopeptide (TPR) repeat protein